MEQMIQNVPFAILILVIGFMCLVKGADFFVEGSSSVAKRLKIPSIIIGLTIVAMGTSLPEAAVSISASIQGNNALAISNVVGSNIFNLMVVIGVCTLFVFVPIEKSTLKRDFPFSVICALVLLVMGVTEKELGRGEGIVLVILFAVFIWDMIRAILKAKKNGMNTEGNESIEAAESIEIMSVGKSILFILGGMVGVAIGGDLVVESASAIATSFGISQTLIGLTIVSIGTSLPELVTSVVAAKKKEVGMALGNAIGSNIFNILMVLGIAGAISPIMFITENIIDILVLIVFSAIVWIVAWKNNGLKRKDGLFMIVFYSVYMVYICIR